MSMVWKIYIYIIIGIYRSRALKLNSSHICIIIINDTNLHYIDKLYHLLYKYLHCVFYMLQTDKINGLNYLFFHLRSLRTCF